MIIEKHGDILASTADALVNPINTRGVMGAGLALQVKRAYPSIFAAYKAACERGEVVLGRMWVVTIPNPSTSAKPTSPPTRLQNQPRSSTSAPGSSASPHSASAGSVRYMVNFPTKDHWRAPSRMSYIEDGLVDLVAWIKTSGVKSIAVPKLGCANGGMEWSEVRPVIVGALEGLDVRVELYV